VTVADVVLAVARAAVPGRQVFDADEAQGANPDASGYGVVYCSEGAVGRTGISGTPDQLDVDLTMHWFAPSNGAAAWLSVPVVNALLAATITIPGYQPAWFTDHQRATPGVDNDVAEQPLTLIVDQMHLTATKA
jgi:hypothetical protein